MQRIQPVNSQAIRALGGAVNSVTKARVQFRAILLIHLGICILS